MSDVTLAPDLLDLLRKVDTPTVCNAIEIAQGKRGFDRYTKGTMQHSRPGECERGAQEVAQPSGAVDLERRRCRLAPARNQAGRQPARQAQADR